MLPGVGGNKLESRPVNQEKMIAYPIAGRQRKLRFAPPQKPDPEK